VQVVELPHDQVGVEWDVRACQSFQAQPGHWLRLRPHQALPR
jgi:hypothetical protein